MCLKEKSLNGYVKDAGVGWCGVGWGGVGGSVESAGHLYALYDIPRTDYRFMQTQVYNKEEKRVSNAIYALCKIISESHTSEIQKH